MGREPFKLRSHVVSQVGMSKHAHGRECRPKANAEYLHSSALTLLHERMKQGCLDGNAAVVQRNTVGVKQKHAGDVYYLISHVIVEIMATNPVYAAAKETGPVEGIPKHVRKSIQFGPAGGFGVGIRDVAAVLTGVPLEGSVLIDSTTERLGLVETLLYVGRGYEGNDVDSPSVFPDLGGLVKEAWDELVKPPQQWDSASEAVELDPEKGDILLERAKQIQQECKDGLYWYLVFDKVGSPSTWTAGSGLPLSANKIPGARYRNCWGFVTDLYEALEH